MSVDGHGRADHSAPISFNTINIDDISYGLETCPIPLWGSHVGPPAANVNYVTDSVFPDGTSLTQARLPSSTSDTVGSDDEISSVEDAWACDCVSGDEHTSVCGVNDGDACDCVGSFGNFYSPHGTSNRQNLLLAALPERLPLVECGSTCPCSQACSNRLTQRGIHLPLSVRSTSTGFGAFYSPAPDTNVPLAPGSFVCLYVGEYLNTEQAHARWAENQPDNYILSFRQSGEEVIHVDARMYSNVARYLNHSCEPNCVILVVKWGGGSVWPRLAIFTKRDVRPGEELTYDYANASGGPLSNVDSQDNGQRGRTKCLCGAAACTGWMPFDETL